MRNTNQYFVQLPNNLAEKYDNKILLVLALILRRKQLDGVCILQLEDIYNKLGLKPKHKYRALIKNLLVKAQNDGVVVCTEDLSRINSTKLVEVEIPVEDNFTQIPYEVIDAIIEYDGSESKYNIFAVYYAIKKHLFTNETTWTIPYDRIKQITGIKSDKTIQNLVGILENMGLITKTLDNTTKTNNNHQRPCFSFSVVSKKEKEKKSSFSNKETTTAKEGRVLVEGNKNISPPTPPTTTSPTPPTPKEKKNPFDGFSLGPERFNSTPYTIPSPTYIQTEKPEDISDEVWQEWLKQPESLRKGKKLVYDPDTKGPMVLDNRNGYFTRYSYRPFNIFYAEYAKRKPYFPTLSSNIPLEESERDFLEEQTVRKLQEITHSVCVYGNEDDEDLPF